MDCLMGIVDRIVPDGPHGPYAVTKTDDPRIGGFITFGMGNEENAWTEKIWPSEGDAIHLSNLKKRRGGWRAEKARPWMLEDDPRDINVFALIKSFKDVRNFPCTMVEFPHSNEITAALSSLDEEQKMKAVMDLFSCFIRGECESQEIYGELAKENKGVFYTVPITGTEIKVWFRPYWVRRPNTVIGDGFLFRVFGDFYKVEKYLKELMKIHPLDSAKIGNTTIYMP
jgi:hypothetical protein